MTNYPRANVLMFVIMFAMLSCGTRSKLALPNTVQISVLDMPRLGYVQNVKKPKKDTVTKVELTDKQRLFYEKYFLPEFASLRLIISKQSYSIESQANSIQQLSDYMGITRHRMDSISHERNFYREKDKQREQQDYAYQKENLRLAKLLIANQKQDALNEKRQVIQNSVIANLALVGVLVLVGIIIGLYRKVSSIDKKFGHLLNNTPNV